MFKIVRVVALHRVDFFSMATVTSYFASALAIMSLCFASRRSTSLAVSLSGRPWAFLTLRLTSNRDMVERSRPKRSAIVTVESPSSMYHFFASFTSVGCARYTPPVWDTPRKWATAHLLGVYDRLCGNTSFRDTPELAEAYSRRLSPHGGGVYSCAPNLRLGHLQPRHGE